MNVSRDAIPSRYVASVAAGAERLAELVSATSDFPVPARPVMRKTLFAPRDVGLCTASITLFTAVSWPSTRLKRVCPFTIEPISNSFSDVDRRRSSKASAASEPDSALKFPSGTSPAQ